MEEKAWKHLLELSANSTLKAIVKHAYISPPMKPRARVSSFFATFPNPKNCGFRGSMVQLPPKMSWTDGAPSKTTSHLGAQVRGIETLNPRDVRCGRPQFYAFMVKWRQAERVSGGAASGLPVGRGVSIFGPDPLSAILLAAASWMSKTIGFLLTKYNSITAAIDSLTIQCKNCNKL